MENESHFLTFFFFFALNEEKRRGKNEITFSTVLFDSAQKHSLSLVQRLKVKGQICFLPSTVPEGYFFRVFFHQIFIFF